METAANHHTHSGDAEAEDDERCTNKTKNNGRRMRLMSGSGQSKKDRQKLRRKQRNLREEILGIADCAVEVVRGCQDRNNHLWKNVRYTREATFDSDNLELIAEKTKSQADKMVTIPRYDALRLAQQLVTKGSVRTTSAGGLPNKFNWRGLGHRVGVCFNALPSNVSFLYGPLEAGYTPKERKKPQRKKWKGAEDGEEEHPDKMDQQKTNVKENELSAVGRNIKATRLVLRKRSREQMETVLSQRDVYVRNISQDGEYDDTTILQKKRKLATDAARVDATSVLFDRNSFTKTVENMYNFSFGVVQSWAGIKVRTVEEAEEYRRCGIEGLGPGPVVYPVAEAIQGEWNPGVAAAKSRDPTNDITQAIVSLNMEQWRKMCQSFDVCDERDSPRQHAQKTSTESECSSPIVTQTNDDNAQSSCICISQTDSQTTDEYASSTPFAAATVTPEKDTPSSPLFNLAPSDIELQTADFTGGIMQHNAKLGVDNPRPYAHLYENSDEEIELRPASSLSEPSPAILTPEEEARSPRLSGISQSDVELQSAAFFEDMQHGVKLGVDNPNGCENMNIGQRCKDRKRKDSSMAFRENVYADSQQAHVEDSHAHDEVEVMAASKKSKSNPDDTHTNSGTDNHNLGSSHDTVDKPVDRERVKVFDQVEFAPGYGKRRSHYESEFTGGVSPGHESHSSVSNGQDVQSRLHAHVDLLDMGQILERAKKLCDM